MPSARAVWLVSDRSSGWFGACHTICAVVYGNTTSRVVLVVKTSIAGRTQCACSLGRGGCYPRAHAIPCSRNNCNRTILRCRARPCARRSVTGVYNSICRGSRFYIKTTPTWSCRGPKTHASLGLHASLELSRCVYSHHLGVVAR